MHAGDPLRPAALEHRNRRPVEVQDFDGLYRSFRAATVAQEVRRTDGRIGFMAPIAAASAGTLPN